MHLPNGSQIFVETTRAANVAVTAISNAKQPVMTVTGNSGANAIAVGDYLIFVSAAWSKLTNRVVRVIAASATSITFEGIDTSNATQFPAGGTAQVAKILTWTELPCIQDLAQDGGEQQYYTYQCLSDDQEQQLPTFKSATSLTYTFGHEYDNPVYPILRTADEGGDIRALRMFVPKAKEMRCWSGVLSFNDIPQTTMNEMETVSLAASLKGRMTFMGETPAAVAP